MANDVDLVFNWYNSRLEKLLNPRWLTMMPLPRHQIYLQPHVTLTVGILHSLFWHNGHL